MSDKEQGVRDEPSYTTTFTSLAPTQIKNIRENLVDNYGFDDTDNVTVMWFDSKGITVEQDIKIKDL